MVVAIIVAIRMFTCVMPPAMMPGMPRLISRMTSGVELRPAQPAGRMSARRQAIISSRNCATPAAHTPQTSA